MELEGGDLARGEARERAEIVRDVRYEVHLDLLADDETFPSETIVRFACTDPGRSTFLDLTAAGIERLHVNGADVEVDTDRFSGTRLQLPPLEAENEVRIRAACAYERNGIGLHRFRDPEDGQTYLYTQFEPFDAHRVFACFDQPDLKAPVTLTVDAPAAWEMVSNSPLAERDGTRRRFAPTPPISTYLVALVTGALEVERDEYDGIPLGIYARASMARYIDRDELFDLTRRGLDFLREAFDQPYPFEKYDQVFVPEFTFGAMENPGCVTFHENYLFRGKVTQAERESRANTLLHEMAHMWFGDLVTMRWWDDLWLNESFATFMATLALERATRFTDAWVTFADEEKAWARKQDQLPTTHPISTDAPDVETALQNFDGITYAKGASVLRQLVAWVGEDEFLEGVRAYFRRYAWGNAELADLLHELESTSGRDLTTWSELWLETAGMNSLELRTETGEDTYGGPVLLQSAPEEWPTLRPHRLRIGLYDHRDGELRRREAIELDVTGASTEVDGLAGASPADLVLVNDGDLAFVRALLDEGSLRTIEEHLADLDDTLARTLCWTTLWEMLRDAELPTGRYLDIVRGNIQGETDIGVLRTIQARMRTATELYGHPSRVAERLGTVADDAWTAMSAAEPGGDLQLAWARHWIACVTTDGRVETVRGLLDGSTSVEGLEVDIELRWHVVRALAAVGALETEAIGSEAARDPSDLGRRRADSALAARPSADAKRWAWDRILDETDLSHSHLKALMGGLVQRGQADLLEPYVERYFTALDRFWTERQREIAMDFTEWMYPTPVVSDELLEATDRHLDRDDLPELQRRTLLEQRDTVVRALRTRDLDAEH